MNRKLLDFGLPIALLVILPRLGALTVEQVKPIDSGRI